MGKENEVLFASFGRADTSGELTALAGHPITLDAGHFLGAPAPDDIAWAIDGRVRIGKTVTWTPNRPGTFQVVLSRAAVELHRITVKVGFRPSDLVTDGAKFDGFLCIIASNRESLVAAPLFRRTSARADATALLRKESSDRHPGFAAMVEAHTGHYRRHIRALPAVVRTAFPEGLYAVFPDSLVFIGANRHIGRAARLVQRVARTPAGVTLSLHEAAETIGEIEIGKLRLPGHDITLGPVPPGGRTDSAVQIAMALNAFTGSMSAFSNTMGLGLGTEAGLNLLINIDARRKSMTSRLFGADSKLTISVQSSLCGFVGKNGSLLDFSADPTPIFKSSQISEVAGKPTSGKDGGSGGGKDGGSGDNGNNDPDPALLLFEMEDDSPSPTDKSDGGSKPTPPQPKDGGTGTPTNLDEVRPQITAESVRWAIFTHGGGLVRDPAGGEEGGGDPGEPVAPGGGFSDPTRPDLFYEWTPTVDEARLAGGLDPRVSDPVDDDSGGSPGPVPLGGTRDRETVPGVNPTLSKTTTFHGNVIVESFSGRDSRSRSTDGLFGAGHIDPF